MCSFAATLDADLGRLASTQYGLITTEQALAIGLSRAAIRNRARAGLLIRVVPGVFRVAGAPRCWQQRAMAVSLWTAPHGAVCSWTAAALHRLDGFGPPSAIDVVTPRAIKSNQALVRVHRTPFLLDADRVEIGRIAATSVARTLIDLAGLASEDRVEVALEDALRRRLTSPRQVGERMADLPVNQPGRQRLGRLLELRGAAPSAESALEVKVIRLLREAGYPPPIRQKVLDDDGRFVGRVDLVWPDRRLIIEVDSYRYHEGRTSFDKDRQRYNALSALGWVVVHATSTMLKEPAGFLRDLAGAYFRTL